MIIKKVKRIIIDVIKTANLYKFYTFAKYKNDLLHKKCTLISMIDGRMRHGGFSDRLCGIISAYKYAKIHDLDFKINYTYPYSLDLFFLPNKVDWEIGENDISYNIVQSYPVYISHFPNRTYSMQYANWCLWRKSKQIHVYTNMYLFEPKEFKALFNTLFRKTDSLKRVENAFYDTIKGTYVSVTFRFQQLLGDFKEPGFPILKDDGERENLINICCKAVEKVYEMHHSCVLVTSDSQCFLERVKAKYSFVIIVPGKVVHMDFISKNENIDTSTHMKSYLDFFILSRAETIYLAKISPLYSSSFPMVASWIEQKPYKELVYLNGKIDVVEKDMCNV